jgi:hypothetical protein
LILTADHEAHKKIGTELEALLGYLETREAVEARIQQRHNVRHLRELATLHPLMPELYRDIRKSEMPADPEKPADFGERTEKHFQEIVKRFNRYHHEPRTENTILDVTKTGKLLVLGTDGHLHTVGLEDQDRLMGIGPGGAQGGGVLVPNILPHADDARIRAAEVVCGKHLTNVQRTWLLRLHYDLRRGDVNETRARRVLEKFGFDSTPVSEGVPSQIDRLFSMKVLGK